MAAPPLTGVVALALEEKPESDNAQVRNALNDTAYQFRDSFYFGNGLLDAQVAFSFTDTASSKGGNGEKKK
jgi:hypothetical protein